MSNWLVILNPGVSLHLHHVIFLFLPVTHPYPTLISPITHLINDMGQLWDNYGTTMGQLWDNLNTVMDRWYRTVFCVLCSVFRVPCSVFCVACLAFSLMHLKSLKRLKGMKTPVEFGNNYFFHLINGWVKRFSIFPDENL